MDLATWALVAAAVGALALFLRTAMLWVRRKRDGETVGMEAGLVAADGVVEIAEVAGVEARANSVDGRFAELRSVVLGECTVFKHARRRRSGLRGSVAIASIFLGRDGKCWSDQEIATAHRALIRAGEWLEREAMAWNVGLAVSVCAVYVTAADSGERGEVALEMANEEYGAGLFTPEETSRILASCSRRAQALGQLDLAQLAAELEAGTDAVEVVWIVHVRGEGRSELLSESVTGVRGWSVAVCYAGEADVARPLAEAPFLDPVTVVHELLHAFGATDKYGTSLARFAKGDVTSLDVMRLDSERLSKLRIDPLTAREIGWYGGGALPAGIKMRSRRPPGWANGGSK